MRMSGAGSEEEGDDGGWRNDDAWTGQKTTKST
jgi:hypothetical protein